MSAHVHSLEAWEELRAGRQLSRRQAQILRWLLAHPRPWTDRQVAERLGYFDMNSVRPRITELVKMDLLEEAGAVKCQVTGKRVRLVRPVLQQAELPL